LPDALRFVVEFARENGTGDELAKASKLVKSLAVALAEDMSLKEERDELAKRCSDHDDIVQSLHGIIDRATDERDQLRVEVTTLQSRLNETSDAWQHTESERARVAESRDELSVQIGECRDQLSDLSSWLSFGIGDENESLSSMVVRVKEGVEHHFGVMTTMRDTAQNERDALRAKLEDLERWRQVTSGEGELPAIGQVIIIRAHETAAVFVVTATDSNGPDSTYQWRPFSSGEAS
jgi:phage shock protein A